MWGTFLSEPLSIADLVSRYLTNYLMERMPIYKPISLTNLPCSKLVLCGINLSFERLSPSYRQVAYALLTRAPVVTQIASYSVLPLDLHVLGLSLAFILSQDQTLRC